MDAEPNDTIDAAHDVGTAATGLPKEIVGTIGDGVDYSSDIDWYQFSLNDPAQVRLTAQPNELGSNSPIVLTLYTSHFNNYDPTNSLGHWLLGQSEGGGIGEGAADVSRLLAPGTYFVAVSGGGNRFFHPYLADSGVLGCGTNYDVQLTATTVAQGPKPEDLAVNQPRFTSYETAIGDDTATTSTDLGSLTKFTVLQTAGAIGDDPFYNVESENPYAWNAASDVDLYHFQITGDQHYAFVGEAFAGRLGSNLDPALTLFRKDENGTLQLVASNNNTLDPTTADNGTVPLYTDSLLSIGLDAGDYYIAVSSSSNDISAGPDGVFDPNVAHSGLNGGTVGEYVLSLHVQADDVAPEAVVSSINEGDTLTAPPTHLDVQFSEPVNVQQLAYAAFQQSASDDLSAVYLQGADGTKYFPRFESYDSANFTASFLLLDALPNGDYTWHISGANGITDLAGLPLVGNDDSGDYVVHFSVAGLTRGSNGDPQTWITGDANESLDAPQELGVLFPHELQSTVTLVRDTVTSAALTPDTSDYYRLEVLQTQIYFFSITNLNSATDSPSLELIDADGNVVDLVQQASTSGIQGTLPPGVYVLHVGKWSASDAANVAYRIEVKLGAVAENPTPLTNGAAPAVCIQLNSGSFNSGRAIPDHLPAFDVPEVSGIAGDLPAFAPTSANGSLVTVFTRSTAPSPAAVPGGLLDGLNAAAINDSAAAVGQYASRSTVPQNNGGSPLVRLFGFNDRDRLFTMLDDVMTRPHEDLVDRDGQTSLDELFDRLVKVTNSDLNEESPAEEGDTPKSSLDEALRDVDKNLPSSSDNVAGTPADESSQSQPTATKKPVGRQQSNREELSSEPISMLSRESLLSGERFDTADLEMAQVTLPAQTTLTSPSSAATLPLHVVAAVAGLTSFIREKTEPTTRLAFGRQFDSSRSARRPAATGSPALRN